MQRKNNMAEEIEDNTAEFDEDIFESMVSGTFDPNEGVEEDDVEDDADEDLEEEDGEQEEDTDQDEESEDEDELDEDGDGDLDEESEEEEDDEEEDTLVEDDDLDDEDEEEDEADEDDESDDAEDEDLDDESEDGAETEETSDGESPETDTVDYKAFYDAVVNTEFTVNGRKSKGFADPKKIIQSMQMAGGFSDKMAGFKKYRPFMAPLQDRGMLEDQSKFDLAMNIIDGDKEAIKKHLESLAIDPLDLDMESISYEGKAATASDASLVVDDAIERAKGGGYEDRFRQVIGKDWDSESFNEFVENPQVRSDLLDHMESGAYDKVQDKIAEMGRLDFNGAFGNLSTIAKYRAAVGQLQSEAPAEQPQTVKKAVKPVNKQATIKAEKAKIAQARKEATYKEEVKAKNAKIAKQRKRAASMSKKKSKPKQSAKFDPMKVEGEDLDKLMEALINGGR